MEENPQASINQVTKVRFGIKAAAFIASVITLSWFFEGWREIHQGLTPAHIAVLAAGILLTALLLMVQGYWIYIEERSKGAIKRRVQFFEDLSESMKSIRERRLN
jgi:hypothetical protein